MSLFPEFPHYDDVLTIPNGWVDISWHNNACPSICKEVKKDLCVVVWCDFKDHAKRRDGVGDFQSSTQFYVSIEIDGMELEPQGEFYSFESAILFGNALFSELVVKG